MIYSQKTLCLGAFVAIWSCEMIKPGRFEIPPAVLTTLVIVLGSAGIIGLSLYTDSREDYLYSSREQIHILMNSWYLLECQMLNLLVKPVTDRDEAKWLYSLKTFDERLRDFLSSPLVWELAGENQLFKKSLSEMDQLWLKLRSRMRLSVPRLAEYIEASRPAALHNFKNGAERYAFFCGSPLYRLGCLSSKDGSESDYEQFAQIVGDYQGVLPASQAYCTTLLGGISNIVSGRIVQQMARLRLVVLVLSMIIVVSMVFLLAQIRRNSHLHRVEFEQLVSCKTDKLEAEKKTLLE